MARHRIFSMPFAPVYPACMQKAQRKGRTQQEAGQIICWLTGYGEADLQRHIERQTDFETFFAQAPAMNPNRRLIQGVVCGIRVEQITDPLMQEIRYLDKLIDELAKGRPMEKILRQEPGLPLSHEPQPWRKIRDTAPARSPLIRAFAAFWRRKSAAHFLRRQAGSGTPIRFGSRMAIPPQAIAGRRRASDPSSGAEKIFTRLPRISSAGNSWMPRFS